MTEPININLKRCKTCGEHKEKNTDNWYMMGAGRKYFSAECKQCSNSRRSRAYVPAGRKRTKFEMHPDLKERAQEMLNSAYGVKDVANELDVSVLTVKKAITMGLLTVPE